MSDKSLPIAMVTKIPSVAPPSFDGDLSLYAFNLFLMTAMTFIGAMLFGRQVSRIWSQRRYDHLLYPVSLYRLITTAAAGAAMLRCGAEALLLWGWNAADPDMTARVIMAKRWIDPISVGLGLLWMSIVILAEPGLEHQLRKAPIPIDMWSRWPVLARALGVVCLSFIAALSAVILR